MRKFWMWIFNNVYLGKFAPFVLGLAIGKKPHRIFPDMKGE